MGLFGNKSKLENKPSSVFPVAPSVNIIDSPVSYTDALDYLVGLSDSDYEKATADASIYRKANKDSAAVHGIEVKPTTSIEVVDDMLQDELETAFLEMDHPAPKSKKVPVKQK